MSTTTRKPTRKSASASKFHLPETWPAPYDTGAGDRLLERFAEQGNAEARLAKRPAVAALLRCLGGNSPYLADLAVRESAALRRLVTDGPDAVVDAAMADLATLTPDARRDRTAAALRRAKRIVALAAALADIGGIWTLEQVTGALSALAETTLALSVAHLLRTAHDSGELHLPDPDNPAHGGGFTALGMGKLGARELNFSSDVDLVLLYDPAAPIYTDRTAGDAMGGFTSRIARGLVSLMEARDADGYVFRTDLRLRPDPAATPPAIALPAAIVYYESMGQNWERAAMIKARPVAGDLALGQAFLADIRPFVWRRGLDFAAVADIHAMKRRIDQHKGTALTASRDPVAQIAGHNVKLGEGGIREIEFLVQTLQLVWGGRDPDLRTPTTLGALHLLVGAGRVPRRAAAELEEAYRFLRQVEHRLQMVADRQTHEVPEKPAELARIATFLGYPDPPAFAEALLRQLNRVRRRYAEVFEHVPDPPDAILGGELDFRGDDQAPAGTIAALRGLGFTAPERVIVAVRGWQAGHVRALRSLRARDLMETMLPAVLARLAAQPNPDATFNRFDRFLAALPAGVQLLSLFQRNPSLLDRVAAVLGASPSLAEHLTRYPAALEGLLSPEEDGAAIRLLQARLRDAVRVEDVIEITRRAVKEEDFYLAVATLDGRLDADTAGERRSAMAEAAMTALLPPVLVDFASRFGRVRGGGMVVVAMGKAGGREMMAGSDLDLMLIYDHVPDATESQGTAAGHAIRALPASQWFVRAAHAYVAALTAPGADGPLYAVDMRLRPSGNKGPVAVSLGAFRRYHAESAWTWERMALTRARVVAGPPALRKKVEAAIADAMAAAGEPTKLRADATAMRVRMLRDLPPDGPWDVKLRPGGLIEVEFVAQVLQLAHAASHPRLCDPTTRVAIQHLAKAGILPAADAALLIRADHVWRTVQGLVRITVGRDAPEALPEASARPLLRAAAQAGVGAVDLPALRATLDELARAVRAVFERHVGEIGG
ncbi:MAG: bifunctional [glutamine synthetase] adenylyltransferase/[glutamine synthetase]-adenylyl-L-tyrosine phosphorylase [Acetobacteraceae bacterium]|nr:bifunctional [glutamine synthetase] adenylyltransferase/[glutamine synthetase]-adenylyl-L-tyrosine phosphorylase [Acetobacteraceae bacterium]